jgi:hypothetical protein
MDTVVPTIRLIEEMGRTGLKRLQPDVVSTEGNGVTGVVLYVVKVDNRVKPLCFIPIP